MSNFSALSSASRPQVASLSARPQLRTVRVDQCSALHPLLPVPLTCVHLLSAFSFAHANYVLQAADFIIVRDIHLLETAVCQILGRALGLHPKTRWDLACGAAGLLPIRYCATRLRILRPILQLCSIPQHIALRIQELRLAGTKPSLAARAVSGLPTPLLSYLSVDVHPQPSHRTGLAHTRYGPPYHLSWPSALR